MLPTLRITGEQIRSILLLECLELLWMVLKYVLIIGTVVFAGYIYYYLNTVVFGIPPVPVLKNICWGKEINCKVPDTSIRSFEINVSDEVLDDLRYRLEHAIIPEPIDNAKQHYGFNGNTLKEVIDYWLNEYDWKKREDYLNQVPQYKTRIQGLDIHFIHIAPFVDPNIPVYPLLICHGWGGSVREFYDILPLLTMVNKQYGFVFEVILPSLPGFIFSEATTKPGLSTPYIALIFKNLMERLGHKQFYVHGGDWGSIIIKHMATIYPDSILGLHTTLPLSDGRSSWLKYLWGTICPVCIVDPARWEDMYPITEKLKNFLLETGYYHIQATKPDTVGIAVSNSPVGLAAYLLEKFSTLANSAYKDRDDAGLLESYTYEKLIDNLMLYWITKSFTSASRLYYESLTSSLKAMRLSDIPIDPKVPCALAKYPHEVIYQPDCILLDKYSTIIQSVDHGRGGHFAAFENGMAQVFARDIFSAVEKMVKFNKQKATEK